MTTLVSAEDVLPGHPDRLCDALAEAVTQLAADAGLRQRLGRSLQERVRRQYSSKEMAARYVAAYEAAVAAATDGGAIQLHQPDGVESANPTPPGPGPGTGGYR